MPFKTGERIIVSTYPDFSNPCIRTFLRKAWNQNGYICEASPETTNHNYIEKLQWRNFPTVEIWRYAKKLPTTTNVKFKTGEKIIVSYCKDFNPGYTRIFLEEKHGLIPQYTCVRGNNEKDFYNTRPFGKTTWDYAKKIKPKFKIDTKLLVTDDNCPKPVRAYFAGWAADDRVFTFPAGRTSWSALPYDQEAYEIWSMYEEVE